MEDRRKKIIERAKEILIAVLFLTAILLLSFFWKDISLEDLSSLTLGLQEEDDSYRPEISQIVTPERIEINFGSDSYTVLSPEWQYPGSEAAGDGTYYDETIYGKLQQMMKSYLEREDITPEKIGKEQFDQVMSYPSVSVQFMYDIPFTEYLESGDMLVPSGCEIITHISMFAFSSASSENLFVYDDTDGSYYRFVTGNEPFADEMSENIMDIVAQVEQSGAVQYYSLESLAGVENDTLIPVYVETTMPELKCSSEFYIGNKQEIARYEQMFFPAGLDFVRKITKNKGSLLYTYGYSQRVLVLDETGSISYTEEPDPGLYSEMSFYAGLEQAVEYVRNHGGWSNMKNSNIYPYLSQVDRISREDGKYKGYRYEFSIKYNGIPVKYSSGCVASVEIIGGQVTSFQRDVVMIDDDIHAQRQYQAENAIDVITDGYDEMAEVLASYERRKGNEEQALEYQSEERFETVVKNIDSIRYCLMRDTADNPSEVVPAWYIRIGKCRFWYSLEDGHLLDYMIEEAV